MTCFRMVLLYWLVSHAATAAERQVRLDPIPGYSWHSTRPTEQVRQSSAQARFLQADHRRDASFGLQPTTRPSYQSPIEVLGITSTIKTVDFLIAPDQNPDRLHLRIHRPAYGPLATNAKASLQINGGSWIDLLDDHSNISIEPAAQAYGGLGGGFHTMWITIHGQHYRQGMNTLLLRFNGTDGRSSGFRVLDILPAVGSTLLSTSLRKITTQPDRWQAPDPGQARRREGHDLWTSPGLLDRPGGRRITASCADCHAQSGADLEYYSYSNEAIVIRSQHHGLSQSQGEAIASYIRGLPLGRHGRPWQPPYQPGSDLDTKPAAQWAAGAGLEQVLAHDHDMLPHLFPHGTQLQQLQGVIDADRDLNLREIPLAVQFPDWNEWLPDTHPQDIWPRHWQNGQAKQGYDDVIHALSNTGADTLLQQGRLVTVLDKLDWGIRTYINTGRTRAIQNSGSPWRTVAGTVMDGVVGMSAERAKQNIAKWSAVKHWEIMHAFALQDRAPDSPSIPSPELRAWPMKGQAVHAVAPHITSDTLDHFHGQPSVVGDYFSSIWYQLQMTLNAGMRQRLEIRPVDWPYQLIHIKQLSRQAQRQEPLRFYASAIKMYQSRNNGDGPTRRGWTFRQVHPWRLYADAEGRTSLFDSLDARHPDLRARITTVFLHAWLAVTDNISLQTWPRMQGGPTAGVVDWYAIEVPGYIPSNMRYSRSKLFAHPEYNHADNFYRLIPRLREMGVRADALDALLDWCEAAWPGGQVQWRLLRSNGNS